VAALGGARVTNNSAPSFPDIAGAFVP
jgi:hypothetical protein